jgi:seryl-tRNA synthetase
VNGRDKPRHDALKSAAMFDIKWIREHPEAFDKGLKRRGLEKLSGQLISIDERRRAIIRVLESFQADRNAASKLIGEAKRNKDESKIAELTAKVALAKESIPRLEREQKEAEEELKEALSEIPNTPADDVPDGVDAAGNVEHHVVGRKRDYAFKPKLHFELGEALGMMDFELAAKLSGARFVVLQKGLARMERALAQLFLDVHTSEKHGYTEVNPPLMVDDDTMFGTAQLPKFAEDQFFVLSSIIPKERDRMLTELQHRMEGLEKSEKEMSATDARFHGRLQKLFQQTSINEELKKVTAEYINLLTGALKVARSQLAEARDESLEYLRVFASRKWLIPTAEVPLTNLVRGSIVEEDKLPMRLTACTPCFRAEAGAAGKDTRGMIRQHQFTKVELVSITTPEQSKAEHERMLACAEEVLKRLDLHYRVVTLCTGDMGFASQKTYDIEVWLPGENAYREISSCSNCGEFQAQRMKARYKGKDGKVKGHVHTLNGSGVAVGRALIAVMETYQDDKGAIVVPDAVKPYMGGITKIERA